VNAPFSRPNSSLSIRLSGNVAQFTLTMTRPLPRLCSWMVADLRFSNLGSQLEDFSLNPLRLDVSFIRICI
jgi:hypothetical protein